MAATSISTAAQTTTATKPIVPAIDDPEIIYPAKIYSNDPLYRLLKNHGSGINDYVIIAIVGVLTAVVFFGPGALLHTQ